MTTTTSKKKLSTTQVATLKALANGRGWDTPPAGYRNAGRDASRWWRTMDCLARQGLVEYCRSGAGGGAFEITQAGRDMAATFTQEP